jgi:predicted DNA-binding transcriptional regulator AlpA
LDAVVVDNAQIRFDKAYITSGEICDRLGLCRTSVLQAKKRGTLPDSVMVGGTMLIWERAKVEPYLDAWSLILRTRRATAAPA